MNVYLLDTHVLYWHLSVPGKLSPAAKKAIEDGETGQALLVISHIVLAELYFLLKKLGQDEQFPAIVAAIRADSAYRIEPVVLDGIENLAGFAEIPEMHDRLIALAAKRLSATLLTKDPLIQASPQISWIW
jgi:PIN domain nuclease of toxin-antitoxin system